MPAYELRTSVICIRTSLLSNTYSIPLSFEFNLSYICWGFPKGVQCSVLSMFSAVTAFNKTFLDDRVKYYYKDRNTEAEILFTSAVSSIGLCRESCCIHTSQSITHGWVLLGIEHITCQRDELIHTCITVTFPGASLDVVECVLRPAQYFTYTTSSWNSCDIKLTRYCYSSNTVRTLLKRKCG